MNFQEKAAHSELYKKLKEKQKENTSVKQQCDLDFYQCRKEIQCKIYKIGKYLESNYELESSHFIHTWLALNCSKRTIKLRRDGIYQQYEYPQNFRNLEDYLIKLTLFEDPSPWFWRITEQFRKNVINNTDIDDILTVMQLTLKGFFQEGNMRVSKTIPLSYDRYQCCFTQQFKQKFVILFEVVVEIYPLFNKLNQFQGTEIMHTMIFYNILSYDSYSEQQVIDLTKRYLDNQSDHRDQKFQGKANGVYRESYQKELFSDYTYGNYYMQDINVVGKILYTCSEFLYKHRNVPKDKLNQYRYDYEIGAWVCMELDDPQLKRNQLQKWINEFLITFDSILPSGKLIKLLEIPSLNIEMTSQEKNIIGAQGNILVMGRSGTGKTTCAVLRLFGLQLLYKQRMSNFKIRNKKLFDNQGITENDIDNIGLKCVFVTASPVLANQVKKYYQSLIDKLVSKNNQNNKKRKEQSECPLTDEDKNEEDEDKFMADMKYVSFDDMSPKDFPAFFTIRKLIQLIDGSLQNPFFSQFKNQSTNGNTQLLSKWHSNHRAVRSNKIHTDLVDSDDDQKIESDDILKSIQSNLKLVSQEVTYEVFEAEFWPTLKIYSQKLKGITSGLLWTHIYSYIKGSALSHSSWKPYLNTWSYYKLKPKLMIKKSMMKQIYEIFIQYEEWKNENNYYDLMDAVNYILIQIKNSNTQFHKIHYLMVDEVQDLPDNVLLLLLRVTQFGTVFSGDTAQNIAKGVGFRFQDLNSLFSQYANEYDLNELKDDQFKRYHLTINFRSHNNILQLANSIISVLELCFPQTIDILEKEKSNLIGPKPIIIYSQETLFMILNGTEEPLKFGCNQVIIVRDQESKEKIPQILKHALILTIYEAKGLEFNDVILYNFFNEATDQWSILEKLSSESQLVDIEEFKNTITLHNQGVDDQNIYGYQKIDNKYLIKKIKFNKKSKFDLQQYSLLCNDLKQLYVAITRAKRRFIIYDDDSSNREGIQNIWNQLQLVDIYHKNDIPKDLQNQIQQTSPQEWQQQGKMLFDNKFYLQSMKCFQLSGDDYEYKKANAYYLAGEATILFSQLDTNEKNAMKKIDIQKQYKQYRDASKLFLEISNPRQAAKCLYSAGDYLEAIQIYEDQGWIKEAAKAAYQCKLYSKAGDLFFEIEDFTSALDAYENAIDYDGLYKTLLELKQLFDPKIQMYIKKYFVLVLSSIQDQLQEGSDKKHTLINQKEHIKSINEIDERSEYSIINNFYFNTSQDQQIDQFNIIIMDQQQTLTQQQLSEQLQLITQNEDDFSIISKEDPNKSSEQNQNQSGRFIMNAFQNEVLSNDYEPLKLERNSSIVSIKSPIITDFSIISSDRIDYPVTQSIQTGCQIQDQLLQIIKWLSMYSEEFKQLIQRKSKIEIQDVDKVELDLDQVDLDFVDLILNILEQFQLFKLCIFVCNRYELTKKLSRFIISIAAQKSPIMMNPLEILRGRQIDLNKYKQMGFEASKDIHSVLCYLPKDLLQQDILQDQLLIQLIMLGYWKQTAQQLSFDDALYIFRVFYDFQNWKNLYFKSVIDQLQIQFNNEQDILRRNNIQGRLLVCQKKQLICLNSHPQDLFYFDSPNNELEKQFTINNLEHIYVELNRENNNLIKIKLPKFLVNTEILWNSIQQDKEIPERVIVQLCSNFNNYTQQFQLYESILFMITYVKYVYHNQNSRISQQYQKEYSNKTIILIRDCLQLIINSIKANIKSQKEQAILDSILLLNKISQPKGYLFKHFQEYFIVRRDSKILEKLIKKKENQIKNCHFIDLDFEFLIAPKEAIIQITQKQFKFQVQSLFSLRQSYSCNQDRNQTIEQLATIIANRYNNSQYGQYSANNQSQQMQSNIELLLNYEDNDSINGFLDEFIAQIMNTNDSSKIEPTVKVKLIEIALTYLNQSKSQIDDSHYSIIKGMILQNFVQKNHYSYLFIEQISKINQEFKQYHKYLEYLVCRKYNIISDASECYFDYYDTFKQILNVDEILSDLTYLFVHQLISLKQQVYLPQLLINYINQPMKSSIKKPIYLLSNQDQIIFTIQCLIENFDQIIIFAPQQIIQIITSYVLNIDVIPIYIITQLENLRNRQVQLIIDNIQYSPSMRIQNICPNQQFKFLDNQQLFEIQVENTLDYQQQQNNYQDCMKEWEFIASQKKNLTQKANKIEESWKQYKFNNLSDATRSLQNETKVKDKIKSIRMTLIQMIYTLRLGVEFPMIYQKLEELYQKEDQYTRLFKDHHNNKIDKQALQQSLNKQINELNLFDIQMGQWRSTFKEKQQKNN